MANAEIQTPVPWNLKQVGYQLSSATSIKTLLLLVLFVSSLKLCKCLPRQQLELNFI
jgi:hypothetical protein